MIVTCQQMQAAEEKLFSSGQDAEPLMDKAGAGCASAVDSIFAGQPGEAVLFCGPGNNGGDALVVGAHLRKWGWRVRAEFSHPIDQISALARGKYSEFQAVPDGSGRGGPLLLVDGLLGIGSRGSLRGPVAEAAARLNSMRVARGAISCAIDIPTGIDGDSGEPYEGAVIADHTLTICAPKRGLVMESSINHVGRIHLIPLPEIPVDDGDTSLELLHPGNLFSRIPRRPFDTHKGAAGRVSIVAGSRGLTGAAVLTSLGALHSGAGLVTVFVPPSIYPVVASRAPLEVMVRPYTRIEEIETHPADVFAVGPGLGEQIDPALLRFATANPAPMVLDADMLNWMACHPTLLGNLPPGQRVLTPHPGELKRLSPQLDKDRIEAARSLARKWNVTLHYKGARTVVATEGQPTGINSTGTPAMASGGMGDVLTGMIAGLFAQRLPFHAASCLGSWCLGRAAETVPGSVIAGAVAENIGKALDEIRHPGSASFQVDSMG